MTTVKTRDRGDALLALVHDHPGKDAIALRAHGLHSHDGRLLGALERGGLVVYKSGGWYLTARGDLRLLEVAEPTPDSADDTDGRRTHVVAHRHNGNAPHTHKSGDRPHSHFTIHPDPEAEHDNRPGHDFVTGGATMTVEAPDEPAGLTSLDALQVGSIYEVVSLIPPQRSARAWTAKFLGANPDGTLAWSLRPVAGTQTLHRSQVLDVRAMPPDTTLVPPHPVGRR